MANTTVQLKNVNLLTKAQYDGIDNQATDELYAVETPTIVETYSDDKGNWYRIYSDGWVEQGGNFGAASTSYQVKTITFLKPFKDTMYNVTPTNAKNSDGYAPTISAKTSTSCSIRNVLNENALACWQACGQGE